MTEDQKIQAKKALERALHMFDIEEHKDLKSSRKKELEDEWYYFALSYLKGAHTLISFVENNKDVHGRMHIIPSVYNFRHGIELSIKYLSRSTDIDIIKSHDTLHLFRGVCEKLRNISAKKVNQYLKINQLKNISVEDFNKIIEEFISDLESIINKYYFQTPLQKSLKNEYFYIEDKENELFKYPEAKNITFYFKSISMINLPEREHALIKQDIERVMAAMSLFFILFNPVNDQKGKT